jgi:transcriptional regulator with XRE-family HTH domain
MNDRQRRRTLYARLLLGLLTVVSVPTLIEVLLERSDGESGTQLAIAIGAVAIPATLFVIVDVVAAQRPRRARQAIRQSRAAWAEQVTRAMEARSTTLADVAAATGVSAIELELWLRGWRDPDPRRIPRLADVLELSPIVLLEQLGYLPPGTYSRLLAVDSTRQQVRQVMNHQTELEKELGIDSLGRSSVIVGSALGTAASGKGAVPSIVAGLRPRGEGAAAVDDFHEYVAFFGLPGEDSAARRRYVEHLVGAAWSKVSAHWEYNGTLIEAFLEEVTGSADTAASLAARCEVVIVPRLLTSRCPPLGSSGDDGGDRRPGRRAPRSGPDLLVLLGLYHSGSADVGALIAREWDYGYCHLSNFAVQVYGRSSARQGRYELELAEWFAGTSVDAGQRWVVVPDDYDAVEHLPRRLLRRAAGYSPEELAVVLLECDDDLLRYSEGQSRILQARQEATGGLVDSTIEGHRSFVDASERQHRIRSGVEALGRRGAAVIVEPVRSPICPTFEDGSHRYGSQEMTHLDDPLYSTDTDRFFSSYEATYRRVLRRLDDLLAG